MTRGVRCIHGLQLYDFTRSFEQIPDLVSYGYLLFTKLKMPMKRTYYKDVPEIETAVSAILNKVSIQDLKTSFEMLTASSERCFPAEGAKIFSFSSSFKEENCAFFLNKLCRMYLNYNFCSCFKNFNLNKIGNF